MEQQDHQPQAADHAENASQSTTSATYAAPQNVPVPAAAPVIVKQSGGKGLAVGALVLSLLALGGAGLLFVQGQNTLENVKLDYRNQLDKAALGQSDNAQRLQQSLFAQETLQQDYRTLQSELARTQAQLERTQSDYRTLTADRMQWLVNEVEYRLNTTAQQLLFDGNTRAASETLRALEKRLNRFDAPELLPLKQAVSEDLKTLDAQPTVDIVAASLRLDRLLADADNLPLLMDNLLQENAPQTVPIPTGNAPWYKNLWQGVKENMNHLVEVRQISNPDAMMLAPDQVYFVRQNIKLRLLDARVALQERRPEIYRNDLNAVTSEVNRYFDVKSVAVRAWLDEALALKELDIRPVQVDVLKNSLAAVRAYQNEQPEMLAAPTVAEETAASKAVIAVPSAPAAEVPASEAAAASAAASVQGGV
ncbi:MAG: uroporphyrinogen-III C-methyltransferase [Neisseria sp.]|nr:uroporphyrinogen-III C-methyltransferase [Neisseria sp.]